jgi:hypothetical protein
MPHVPCAPVLYKHETNIRHINPPENQLPQLARACQNLPNLQPD